METMKIRLTFVDDILGTNPGDPEIHSNYIASKAPDAATMAEEIENYGVEAVTDKGKTFFDRMEDGTPCLYNYQVKGFFKSACSALRRVSGTESAKTKAFKKIIDTTLFVYADANNKLGRKIPFTLSGQIGNCQRPLRASTPQGERVALADSESIPKGSSITFDVEMFMPEYEDLVMEWLDYGIYNGLGQWRNSGSGAFVWERLDEDGTIIGGNKNILAPEL